MKPPHIVVYTAIFDYPDKLYEPAYVGEGVTYTAFLDVDDYDVYRHWNIVPRRLYHPIARRSARKHKLLSHELFDSTTYTLWIDGCLTPKHDPRDLVDEYLQDTDIAVFQHSERSCVYQELEACLQLKKDDPETMRAQIDRHRKAGYPYNNGLGETTAVLRRHTDKVKAFNDRWWYEVEHGSLRDQLSFDFVAWQMGVSYATFRGKRYDSPHFTWRSHIRRR